ncbi:MAG: N-acetylmuramic acid 6-phosphate etherase [Flavobacteriaceae bacterium]|nr:N-acetylmuramic acid 6-phosphate etherase [Flavobacteriaceae bacterium]
MSFKKTTESTSQYDDLEKLSVNELLTHINKEDQSVPYAVHSALPQIERLTEKVIAQLKQGGRLFYIGAGTSGRLGIVDASECPPTFGVDHGLVVGIMAGGDQAIRKAVEFAEDSETQGWTDLKMHNISEKDIVIGIAASGTTPYVIEGLKECNNKKIPTGCITCNAGSPLATTAKYPIEVVVGAEFVTGSTRMKAGTAQKLVLNMISTATMIQLGHVKGNRMVDMRLSNNKLVERGTIMLMEKLALNQDAALKLLQKHGSVRKAIQAYEQRH